MSEKRFYRSSVCGDEGLYDKEDGCIIVNVKSNIDLNDNWNTVVEKLNELSEEKEYFERKKEYFLSKWSIVHAKNIQLRQEIKELKKENEQLREKNKQIGYLKRDLFILINLIRDTPVEFDCDFEKIVERWE